MERMGDALLRELVYGRGAHVNPLACVEDISAEVAARRVAGYPHSIWQIVEHMNFWMDHDLGNISGQNRPYPDHAVESWPIHPLLADGSRAADEAWQAARRRFIDLLATLAGMAESDAIVLERKVQHFGVDQCARESTVNDMLWQIAAHNSYHAGQIVLLRRQLGAWPPLRGGDTW
jgi:uncharacterized damage-inducible protein DinB